MTPKLTVDTKMLKWQIIKIVSKIINRGITKIKMWPKITIRRIPKRHVVRVDTYIIVKESTAYIDIGRVISQGIKPQSPEGRNM